MLRFTPLQVHTDKKIKNEFMKLRKNRNCFLMEFLALLLKNMDSSASTSERSENVFLVFIPSLVSFGLCIYVCSGKSVLEQKISTRVN